MTLFLAAAGPAAEKRVYLGSFDRLRVEGPYRVVVTTGSPGGTLVSDDPRAFDRVEVHQDGDVVVIRRAQIEERDRPVAVPLTITLATPALASVALIGAGEVAVTGLKAPHADLSVAGSGTIAVTGADADDLTAISVGNGRIGIAGRAGKARLTVNGAGGMAADALDAGELTVRLDGPGEVAARARYTALVSSSGLGRVAVAGNPKCTVRAAAGQVVCGAAGLVP